MCWKDLTSSSILVWVRCYSGQESALHNNPLHLSNTQSTHTLSSYKHPDDSRMASTSCKSAQEIIGGSLTSSTHCTKNGSAEPTLAFVRKWECFPAWKHQDKLEYLFILSCSLLLWEEAHLEMEVPVKTTTHSWFICFQAVINNLNLNLKFTQYVIWLCLWTHMVAQ